MSYNATQSTPQNSRPASVASNHAEDSAPVLGKRKGMLYSSHNSMAFCATLPQLSNHRTISVHTAASDPSSETQCTAPLHEAGSHLSSHEGSDWANVRNMSTSNRSSLSSLSQDMAAVRLSPPVVVSQIPLPQTFKPVLNASSMETPLRDPKPKKSMIKTPKTPFLTRNTMTTAWDTKGRLEDMEYLYSQLQTSLTGTTNERNGLEETVDIYKTRVNELERIRSQLATKNSTLKDDLESTRRRLKAIQTDLDDERRLNAIRLEDMQREHRYEVEELKRRARDEIEDRTRSSNEDLAELERRLNAQIETEKSMRIREVQESQSNASLERQEADTAIMGKNREVAELKVEIDDLKRRLEREVDGTARLQDTVSIASASNVTLEATNRALKAKIDYLESDGKSRAEQFSDVQQQLQQAKEAEVAAKVKLQKEETLRRKLHNQVQELKGNIRVFCRVRPTLEHEQVDPAQILFPDDNKDAKEIEVQGPEEKSSLGTIMTKKNAFAFDRTFGPTVANEPIYDEISQLVQSALDGYNVCIFAYGQTGSGKTYTMSSDDGMIPRAVHQIYDTATALMEKGWTYTMEGSFVEVYNENLNDLLGKAEEFDKKKHEIRHDTVKCKTTITDLTTVTLDSPAKVESILRKASTNRSVAATAANERSSRSHSVFILRLTGTNNTTGEKSEGTLNLVDLAGSERLSHSGSTGERLKETQNINKSLSCLGDVIGALGSGKEGAHIPYRNSKLTYLLQYSLGGNSKTLMFVMVSPLQAHLNETLTSLKFATKVRCTNILGSSFGMTLADND
jgi:kinesin family member C1